MATRSRETQARFSESTFRDVVWPDISSLCGGGTLQSVERSGYHELLDLNGGIDAYQVFSTGIRTIAQRTERVADYGKKAAFTIRAKTQYGNDTEWQKRLAALDGGYDLPTLMIHSYVKDDLCVRSGIAYGRYLLEWVRANLWRIAERKNPDDGNVFFLIPWVDLVLRDSRVPYATKDIMVQTRYPADYPWPEGRWI